MTRRLGQLAGGLCATVLAIGIGSAYAQDLPNTTDVETAALTHGDGATGAVVPTPLGAADAKRYRGIFELQQAGKWREADVLIKAVTDRLVDWTRSVSALYAPDGISLEICRTAGLAIEYADHPGANRVYRLALRRKPDSWKAPRRPIGVVGLAQAGATTTEAGNDEKSVKKPGRRKSRHVYRVQRQIKSLVARGRPTQARNSSPARQIFVALIQRV